MPRKQTTGKTIAKRTTTRKQATTSARKTAKSSKKMTLVSPADLDIKVRERAYEKYLERGGWHGADMDDWFRAEEEVKKELSLV